MKVLNFFRDLLQSHVDSYFVVAQTISCLQDIGGIVEQKKLLSQLHLSIQELHNYGIIKYMNSCLIEVLETAFGRFAQLGLCDAQVYNTQLGEKIIYIKSKLVINNSELESIVQLLSTLSSVSYRCDSYQKKMKLEKNLQEIEKETQLAIMAA